MDNSMKFDIFVDGSSLIKGSYYESSSACAIFHDGKKVLEAGKFHEGGTISLGEVYAVKLALDKLAEQIKIYNINKNAVIRIFSDSDYNVNSLTKWLYGWKKQGMNNEWVSSSGKPVAYQDIFKYIYNNYLINPSYDIKVYHMNGHIKEKISLEKAYKKFLNKSKLNMSISEFEVLVDGNSQVDRIAENVRLNKLTSYFREGEHEWTSSTNWMNFERRDGRIVIKARKR